MRALKAWFSKPGNWLVNIVLPALVVLCVAWAQLNDPLFRSRMRDQAFDQLEKWNPAALNLETPVRVVAIDDPSLAEVGQWPWPRTVLAQVIAQLNELGARAIVLDLVMAEPDRTSPEQVRRFWPDNAQLDAVLNNFPSHDLMLANTVSKARVVLAVVADNLGAGGTDPGFVSSIDASGAAAMPSLDRVASHVVANLPPITAAASGVGVAAMTPDYDGIVRSMPLVSRIGDALYPSLGLEGLRVYLGMDRIGMKTAGGGIQGTTLGGGAYFPTSPESRVWLHFRPFAKERYLSAIDVLTGKVEPARVKDHIILIGATSAGLGDIVRTPLGEAVPGVEGHLQLTEQLLTHGYLLRPTWENAFIVAFMLFNWLVIALMVAKLRPVWLVAFTVVEVAGLALLSWALFLHAQLLLDPVFPAASVVLLSLSLMVPHYLRTEREQRWIKTAFSRYVSPNRVKYLQEHPETLELGGEYRECSFVMTDLAGFTAMMEKYPPAMLSALLNEYLNGMIEIAFAHEGTLDRIVGDAVAVMFSAPVIQTDHAQRALRCALAMDEFANAFSLRQRAQGIPFGITRIGVNTGEVMVGNFGGQVMLDYRALGDAINLAARLESINGQLGTRICVSESTVKQCPEFRGRLGGRLVLKGKTIPIAVYQPLTEDEDQSAAMQAYRQAYALMDSEDPTAAAAFEALVAQYPDDPLANYHHRRLSQGDKGSLVVMSKK